MVLLGTLLLALYLLVPGNTLAAQSGENRAGLVVQFADGSTKTYCVAFAEETISGLDLLLKTGLDVRAESFAGAGALICKIGPDGCDFPEQPCVCKSYGPEGVYWSYFHLKDGRWRTSGVGISGYKLGDGAVDGLAWSAGKPPPLFTFSQICAVVGPKGTQPPAQAQTTPKGRPPGPAPTRILPSITSEPPGPMATSEPTLQPPTARPSSTRLAVTRTRTPLPAPRLLATSTRNEVKPTPTFTMPIAQPPTATVEAAATATSTTTTTNTVTPPTYTPSPEPKIITVAPVLTATPYAPAIPATPMPVVINARSDTGESTARNIGIGIGLGTLAGLVAWGIWRGRRNRGQDVG